MRAVVVGTSGRTSPRTAKVVDLPRPGEPTGTQVLVRVAASSVNGTDLAVVDGAFPTLPGRTSALGFDVAGEVLACGPKVTSVGVGDRVMALLGHSGGGQAEEVLVPQDALAVAPTSVRREHAAALPLAGLTALAALPGRAALHRRRTPRVLVFGAAGGIGSFAVQLARLGGGTVTAAARGARHDYLHELGADEVIDTATSDPLRRGKRWDVVVDTPAALTFTAARHALSDDGVMVSTRPLSLDVVRTAARRAFQRSGPSHRVVATRPSGLDLARLVRLVDAGQLRIPIDSIFPLAEVSAAHQRVRSGDVKGKVVLRL